MTAKYRFNKVAGCKVRFAAPTRKHRVAIWECMLGTVYAYNGEEVRYFDYNWAEARRFAGVMEAHDPRFAKVPRNQTTRLVKQGDSPKKGTWVIWVLEKIEDDTSIRQDSPT